MKKKNKSKFSPLAIIFCVLLLALIAYIAINKNIYQIPQSATQNQVKTYQSRSLKFLINLPTSTSVRESQTYVDITFKKGLIDIVRNGTNFSSLSEYLKDSDVKKGVQVNEEDKLMINGYQANTRVETNPYTNKMQKTYYIYIENWAYTLSTSSPSLYGDLDQIAQSFRYAP